jgi:hypothetical protein
MELLVEIALAINGFMPGLPKRGCVGLEPHRVATSSWAASITTRCQVCVACQLTARAAPLGQLLSSHGNVYLHMFGFL